MSAELAAPARRALALAARLRTAALAQRGAGGSALLFANAMVGAAGGVVFWAAAAWTYDMAAVGVTTAMASAATLVASFANLGLSAVVMRYLTVLGPAAGRVRAVALLVPPVLAALACLPLALLGGQGDQLLPALAAATAVILVQDSVFVARGRPGLVLARGVAAAAVRLALLLPAAAWGAAGLAGAYVAGALAAVLAGAAAFRADDPRRARRGRRADGAQGRGGDEAGQRAGDRPSLRTLAGYGASSYVGGLLSQTPQLLYPILIALHVSHAGAGAFAFAWMVAALLMALPQAAASTLLARLATRPEAAEREAGATTRWLLAACAGLGALAMAGVWLIAGVALPASAAEVVRLAPLLLLSVLPYAVARVHTSVLLLQGRLRRVIALNAAVAAAAVLLPLALLPSYGAYGVEVGWLASQAIGAVVGYRLRATGAPAERGESCSI